MSCGLPRDHRGGPAGGGVAPEKSDPQLMGPLPCGLRLQPCTVPEAGTCLLCVAASLCVELGLDSDPALRPEALTLSPHLCPSTVAPGHD